ncbi:MAG: TatD family hydrolase [Acidimicrobiia bacterium]
MWVDSHCHLPPEPAEADAIIDRARLGGVDWLVCVGTDLETSRASVAHAERHGDVHATVGLHPHDAVRLEAEWPALVELAKHPRVVAIGEAGFDLHYMHSPFDDQEAAFRVQIQLAHATGRALVIHSREAWDHTFRVLEDEGVPSRTVFHCFTGGPDEARRALDLGTYLSFSGIVTFKSADDVRAAARLSPLTRLLVETDAPYLAPVPHRGSTNEPAFVAVVGAGVAAVRGQPDADIAAATGATAMSVFRP